MFWFYVLALLVWGIYTVVRHRPRLVVEVCRGVSNVFGRFSTDVAAALGRREAQRRKEERLKRREQERRMYRMVDCILTRRVNESFARFNAEMEERYRTDPLSLLAQGKITQGEFLAAVNEHTDASMEDLRAEIGGRFDILRQEEATVRQMGGA
ncbi:MAG: hypothetical protein GTO63_07980 [Anaerolineae bacterium]|nr:hypothetical protein [Anaerolineae bacterium]NIN94868.1 hypothetical protein [Anaerolineae bacterium]NIQ77919.1 hypothetical protein [Anaerolineae bacterium]